MIAACESKNLSAKVNGCSLSRVKGSRVLNRVPGIIGTFTASGSN